MTELPATTRYVTVTKAIGCIDRNYAMYIVAAADDDTLSIDNRSTKVLAAHTRDKAPRYTISSPHTTTTECSHALTASEFYLAEPEQGGVTPVDITVTRFGRLGSAATQQRDDGTRGASLSLDIDCATNSQNSTNLGRRLHHAVSPRSSVSASTTQSAQVTLSIPDTSQVEVLGCKGYILKLKTNIQTAGVCTFPARLSI